MVLFDFSCQEYIIIKGKVSELDTDNKVEN